VPRSLKKGPFIDLHLLKKIEVGSLKKNDRKANQDLVAPFYCPAADVGLTIAVS